MISIHQSTFPLMFVKSVAEATMTSVTHSFLQETIQGT